jgi:hypothetical protein
VQSYSNRTQGGIVSLSLDEIKVVLQEVHQMKTITRTEADIEESVVNYSQADVISELKAVALPLDAIANFCKTVKSGDTPPKWMTKFLANRFADFLGNGGKKRMESCFGITPSQFKETQPDKYEIMKSYALIKYLFKMTHNKTAEVVKLWYHYPSDVDTLKQEFQRDWQKFPFGDKWDSEMDEEMPASARATKFLEELKTDQPVVFLKLKDCKYLFKRCRKHPIFD